MRSYRASDLQSLGSAIRERRRQLSLTQEQLASRLHWSQERVSALENGKYGMPSLPLLAHLAEALDLPLRALLEAVGFEVGHAAAAARAAAVGEGAGSGMQLALNLTLQRLLGIQAMSLKGTMDEASDILCAAMGADKVDIFMHQPEIGSLVALATSNTDMGRLQTQSGLDRIPIGNGGRQVQVFLGGEAFYTGQADKDPDVLRGLVETLGVRTMYAVPLEVQGAVRGILVAQSAQSDRFSQRERQFFDAASYWVSMVAHRAELQEELTRCTAMETRQLVAEDMVTIVSHDLANQITPIKGRVDLLLRAIRRQPPREQQYVERELGEISESLRRLATMVSDLLDASRLEGGLFSVTRQRADLVPVINAVVEGARSERPELGARVPDQLVVDADPERVRQVLQNLVGNAIRHTPAGVPVVVSATTRQDTDGEWVVIEVHDDGPGISPEVLPRLFARHAAGGDGAGMGLGLYLSRGIASAHGGTLTVESAPGQGTTFVLSLPLREPAEHSQR